MTPATSRALSSLILSLIFAVPALSQSGKPEPFTVTLPNSVVKLNMVPIPAGKVKIDGKDVAVKPFYMQTTEMPWEAFDLFLTSGPPTKPYDQTVYPADAIARPSRSYILPDLGFGHHGYPAISLSSDNVEMFCRWMSSVTGKKYRVATEAEWQWAALGGKAKVEAADIEKQSWNGSNSDETTHPVASKEANKYGLFDLLGNVGEWAVDLKGKPVLCGAHFQDPPSSVSATVKRYWEDKWQEQDPQIPKSRWWLSDAPWAGFRVVCEP